MPSRPQVLAAWLAHSLSGSVPARTGAQRPLATPVLVIEQALHRLLQAVSQQNPSTQLPEAQSDPALDGSQAAPTGLIERQRPLPVSQNVPPTQSPSDTQLALQVVAFAQLKVARAGLDRGLRAGAGTVAARAG